MAAEERPRGRLSPCWGDVMAAEGRPSGWLLLLLSGHWGAPPTAAEKRPKGRLSAADHWGGASAAEERPSGRLSER